MSSAYAASAIDSTGKELGWLQTVKVCEDAITPENADLKVCASLLRSIFIAFLVRRDGETQSYRNPDSSFIFPRRSRCTLFASLRMRR
jgi:hypothetical protein